MIKVTPAQSGTGACGKKRGHQNDDHAEEFPWMPKARSGNGTNQFLVIRNKTRCSCTSGRQVSWLVSHHAPSPSQLSSVTFMTARSLHTVTRSYRPFTCFPITRSSEKRTAPVAYSIVKCILACPLGKCNPFLGRNPGREGERPNKKRLAEASRFCSLSKTLADK